jgi:hypothetical protein
MKFPIVWVSDRAPQVEETLEYVIPELESIFKDLEKAEDLIFHTIFVGPSMDGPIVMAYGKENDENIYLDYLDDVQWMIERG